MEHNSAAYQNRGKLKLVLAMTLTYLIAEVIGGILTKSLALLADAGHMLTDVGGTALALMAINLTQRKASVKHTFGFYRAEILAALVNAVVLIGISIYILYEAWQRFKNPPEVSSISMLIVASLGLVINIIAMRLLQKSSKESLNMKGAYFEVLSDMLTSIGVIVAGIIMLTTGWYYADPLISAGIGLFILPRTWVLLKDAVGVLLEGTPADVDLKKVEASVQSVTGVSKIHDLHIWALTSGVNSMSAHIVLTESAVAKDVLTQVNSILEKEYNIIHTTIQTEESGFTESSLNI